MPASFACAEQAATLPGDDAALDTLVATATDLVGRTRVFGALDTLENLKKGGRIGGKRSLETMTAEQRVARAKKASKAAAEPRKAKAKKAKG